jgi:hypothetical protein
MRWPILLLAVACGGPAESPPAASPGNTVIAPKPAPPSPGVAAPACRQRVELAGLVICGEPYEAPSHGGEEFVRIARYTIENPTAAAVPLALAGLDIVDPANARTPLSIGELRATPDVFGGGTTAAIAPGARIELTIHGKGDIRTIRYHVVYHHEARFQSGGDAVTVLAGELYFRYPHRR